jgi:hypothetical protein
MARLCFAVSRLAPAGRPFGFAAPDGREIDPPHAGTTSTATSSPTRIWVFTATPCHSHARPGGSIRTASGQYRRRARHPAEQLRHTLESRRLCALTPAVRKGSATCRCTCSERESAVPRDRRSTHSWSGPRDSNPRPSPWQRPRCTLLTSHMAPDLGKHCSRFVAVLHGFATSRGPTAAQIAGSAYDPPLGQKRTQGRASSRGCLPESSGQGVHGHGSSPSESARPVGAFRDTSNGHRRFIIWQSSPDAWLEGWS